MLLVDLTLPTPAENLALDEALLLEAEAGAAGETLRLWEWPRPAVVLGAGGRLAEDVNEPACRADEVPILRRNSGGGTVLLGAGCLVFSLILHSERAAPLQDIGSSYQFILERIGGALRDVVPAAELAGTSDLAVAGLKFSGNAQQRKREYLLHHGTLLYRFDLHSVGRYLHAPSRQPEYRAGREHAAFLMNLPLDPADLRRRLCAAWEAVEPRHDWPRQLVPRLLTEKYANMQWIRRR